MLKIRLARVGAKKKPSYRVVVIDKRSARNSKSVEIVGHYNPTKDPIVLSLDEERIQHWLGQGAQPSDTVRRLLNYKGERSSDGSETRPRDETDSVKEQPAAAQSEASAAQAAPAEEPAQAASEQAETSPEESQPAQEEEKPAAGETPSS